MFTIHFRRKRPACSFLAAITLLLGACGDDDPSTAPALQLASPNVLVGCLPGRGRILFYSTVAGDQELYSVREDGADVRRLTYAVGAERDAVYSPDGSRIAFVATRGIDPRPNIYVMGADGTRTTQLTSSNTFREISGLTWSPDGERLVFSGRRANLVDTQLDLFSMSSAGSSVTRLTTTPDIGETDPAFSPLGDRIAFTAFGVLNGPPAIWTMAPDGSDRTQLIDCLLYGCRYPAWSPDGLYMAFIEYEGTRYVRVIRVGESLVQSRPVGNSTFRPSFSPDGIKLTIAMAGDGDRYQVGTMEMDGSNKTLLTHFGVGAYPTSWGR